MLGEANPRSANEPAVNLAHDEPLSRDATRWLSSNPEKAWAERWLLGYSAAWMLAVAVVIATGWIHTWGDRGYLLFSLVLGLAAIVGPWLWPGRPDRHRPPWECWWLKLNAWVAVLVAFGTYFGTHYFFDLMGMRYGFPVTWTLQAAGMGHSSQTVPVFMYPLTQAYFVTYFVAAPIVLRRLEGALGRGRVVRVLAVLALAYGIAWMETFAMANEGLAAYFEYADRDKMLAFGSLGYATYFVVGLPLVRRIDEGERWPLSRVLLEALAASMLILFLLDAWATVIGPL
jgi:cycloeucalenol cycloisomerase